MFFCAFVLLRIQGWVRFLFHLSLSIFILHKSFYSTYVFLFLFHISLYCNVSVGGSLRENSGSTFSEIVSYSICVLMGCLFLVCNHVACVILLVFFPLFLFSFGGQSILLLYLFFLSFTYISSSSSYISSSSPSLILQSLLFNSATFFCAHIDIQLRFGHSCLLARV